MLDQRQREIAARARAGGPGALLISEVAPVITLGRRTQPDDLLFSSEELAQQGVETLQVDRGGLATSHGPGQWVLFAVDRLERLTGDPRGVRRAVEALLGIALRVGKRYAPDAEIREGPQMGVWTSRGKFASVGVHIEKGVLLHGLSVNGFKAPTSFSGLRPCGLDAPIDYLLEPTVGTADGAKDRDFLILGDRLVEAAFSVFWIDEAARARL